jgi:hypothetical protein
MRRSSRRGVEAVLLAAGALLLTGAGAARSGDAFTIAVIPDTQNYVDELRPQPGSLQTFKDETRYLADHKSELDLVFVTHVGDVVQHGDGTNGQPGDASYGAGAEWARAAEAMDILAASGVPFGMSIGNHDYDNHGHAAGNRPLQGARAWKKHFGAGSRYFAGKPWYGGASEGLAHDPGLSSYQVFPAGGRDFLHIALELEAGDAALAWAQSVVDTHRGYPTIVTTHEYMGPPANGDDRPPLEANAARIAATYMKGSPGGWNDAQQVWEKLIAKNDQIFMVVCGHAWAPAIDGVSKAQNVMIGMNDAGHPVYQVLSDYQGNSRVSPGGDGWLRLMRFDLRAHAIHFTTYSPTLGKYAGRGGEWTFHQPPTFSDFTLPMPVQIANAAARPAALAR